jgi:hypothetical protein
MTNLWFGLEGLTDRQLSDKIERLQRTLAVLLAEQARREPAGRPAPVGARAGEDHGRPWA